MANMTATLGVILLAVAAPAAAQRVPSRSAPAQPRHLGALEACRAIGADAARLACFDRESAALLTASRSGELSVVDRADMRTARRSLFGFALPKLPFFAGDKSADEVPDTLDSTIVTAQGIANDRYRIRIAAGDAVWETTDSPINLSTPRAGEKIVISKGALGSYFLRINGQVGVKGRRIK
ncbi:MAG: hypothetical protein LH466_05125 [Sphingomonas bacterium]|nr:hypothetical protein [Sphingomonas bacterium]